MSAENKAVIRRYIEEVFNQGNLSTIDEVIAPGCVNHDPVNPVTGPDGVRELATKYRTAFPDLHLTVQDMISDGDKVVTRWTYSGTHQGNLEGIAPTGKSTAGGGVTIGRVYGGKIQEMWVNWDALGLMIQLGAVSLPAQARGASG